MNLFADGTPAPSACIGLGAIREVIEQRRTRSTRWDLRSSHPRMEDRVLRRTTMTQGSVSRRRFLYLGSALAAGSALAVRGPLSALASDPEAQTINLTCWTPGGS